MVSVPTIEGARTITAEMLAERFGQEQNISNLPRADWHLMFASTQFIIYIGGNPYRTDLGELHTALRAYEHQHGHNLPSGG